MSRNILLISLHDDLYAIGLKSIKTVNPKVRISYMILEL